MASRRWAVDGETARCRAASVTDSVPSSSSSWASRSALSTDSIAYGGLFFTPENPIPGGGTGVRVEGAAGAHQGPGPITGAACHGYRERTVRAGRRAGRAVRGIPAGAPGPAVDRDR